MWLCPGLAQPMQHLGPVGHLESHTTLPFVPPSKVSQTSRVISVLFSLHCCYSSLLLEGEYLLGSGITLTSVSAVQF